MSGGSGGQQGARTKLIEPRQRTQSTRDVENVAILALHCHVEQCIEIASTSGQGVLGKTAGEREKMGTIPLLQHPFVVEGRQRHRPDRAVFTHYVVIGVGNLSLMGSQRRAQTLKRWRCE